MQTRLLCAFALLCGADIAHAQTWSNGYYQPYQTAPGAYGNYGNAPAYYYNPATGGYSYSSDAANYNNRAFSTPSAPPQYYYPPSQSANAEPSPEATGPVPASVAAAYSPEHDESLVVPQAEPRCKNRFWLSANDAMMFMRQERLNATLVTIGSAADVHPGALGQPGTTVISGDTLNFGMFNGVQADVGVFLDPEERLWLQATGLWVDPGYVRYQYNSDGTGNPLIARPVLNANTGVNAAIIDSFPGAVVGGIAVDARTMMFGTEANLGYRLNTRENGHADFLFGFRYLSLVEDLTILDQFHPIVPNFLTFELGTANPPNSLADMDRFTTKNHFYGLQLGGQYAWQKDRWFFGTFGKAGLGVTSQKVNINGSTQLIVPGGSNQFAGGGVLALPTNMGQYSRNVLGVVPEGGLAAGFNLSAHLQLTAGYSFLYWNQVVRPGGQLNSAINPTQVPTTSVFGTATGPAVPAFQFSPESFWVHTFTCGLTMRF